MDEKLTYILNMYPDAKCELHYNTLFQLLVATVLSAQTTDAKVNACTGPLWEKYPTIKDLAEADIHDVENIIRYIGLYKTKAEHITGIAKIIHNVYHDEIPTDRELLATLPGVGNKTINVYYAEGLKIPALPVDTHINRIAKRLKYATLDDSVEDVERKLKKKIPEELWIQMHHSLIFFGRYFCKAISPQCENCQLQGCCRKKYKN